MTISMCLTLSSTVRYHHHRRHSWWSLSSWCWSLSSWRWSLSSWCWSLSPFMMITFIVMLITIIVMMIILNNHFVWWSAALPSPSKVVHTAGPRNPPHTLHHHNHYNHLRCHHRHLHHHHYHHHPHPAHSLKQTLCFRYGMRFPRHIWKDFLGTYGMISLTHQCD